MPNVSSKPPVLIFIEECFSYQHIQKYQKGSSLRVKSNKNVTERGIVPSNENVTEADFLLSVPVRSPLAPPAPPGHAVPAAAAAHPSHKVAKPR